LDKDRRVYEGVTFEDFKTNFQVGDDVVVRFQNYFNSREERANIVFTAYRDTMKQLIKAALAEQLFGDNEREQITNEKDAVIDEVILLSQENEQ
jgi:carboxyl-terminal processing protease